MCRREGERAESRYRVDGALVLVLLVGAEWWVGTFEVGGIGLRRKGKRSLVFVFSRRDVLTPFRYTPGWKWSSSRRR